jgi:hypothetical protein
LISYNKREYFESEAVNWFGMPGFSVEEALFSEVHGACEASDFVTNFTLLDLEDESITVSRSIENYLPIHTA